MLNYAPVTLQQIEDVLVINAGRPVVRIKAQPIGQPANMLECKVTQSFPYLLMVKDAELTYNVTADLAKGEADCSCSYHRSTGDLCPHIAEVILYIGRVRITAKVRSLNWTGEGHGERIGHDG